MKKTFYFLRSSRLGPWSLFLGLFLMCTVSMAQSRITGRVTDNANEPIPGVNVLVKGTSTGTVTDADGNYSLNAPSDGVLVFSFVGYLTQEVPIANQSNISITMNPDVQQLAEVVVTGYASQEKKDLTGSVGVVDPEELNQIPAPNVTSQLQGRVAGVTVTQDARPGAGARVRIRGFGSFLNNDPLYVVDGVPTQDISTINPGDIESISVLKDAGAASIYGSRASNGVVVITTKRGAEGVQVNYNMYYGTQYPGDGPDNLLDTQGFADLQWLVYNNDGTNEVHPIYGPSPAAGGASPQFPSWAADTDWWDAITRNALITSHDLSLSGGNSDAKFFGSVNWFKQEGITIENFSERFTARFNSSFNIKDRVTVGENITVAYRTGNGILPNGEEATPVAYPYRMQPIIPVIVQQPIDGFVRQFEPGDYGGTGIATRLGNFDNGYAQFQRNKHDRQQDIRVVGSVYADVKIIEGLNFRTTFGGTMQNGYNTDWASSTYESAENVATSAYAESAYYNHDWVWTNTLTFERSFDEHKILAVAGYESVKYGISRSVTARRAGYFSADPNFRTVSNGENINAANSGFGTPTTLVSQFFRADYSFNDRYLLSATVRRDGSSRFGEDNRYGVFPSVSAGWRISEEAFMSDVEFISDFKIRGGYGTMGNQLAVSPQNQFSLYGGGTANSFYNLTGAVSGSLQGFRPVRIGNPDAQWETNISTNIGFDAGFFDNKLEIIFDWYTKVNEDLLYNPELGGIYGAASPPFINIGEMKNTGIDMQVIYRQNFSSDFRFEGNLTFTTFNNEVVKIADNQDFFDGGGSRIGPFNRNQVGEPLGSFFGYEVIGLFQDAAEVASAPTQEGAEPGFLRFADIDGDGAITPADRTFIGNPIPDFSYGLNLSFSWRNFDLTAFLYGESGQEIFNYNKWWVDFWPSFQGQKSTDLLLRSWTPERPGATVPKASNKSNFSTNTQASSYFIEDGSYLRLRNLQLGYNVPANLLSNIGLTTARVYLQGVNLFTITDYTGQDPELSDANDLFPGVDEFNNPNVKQFLIGVNIGF